MLQQLIAEADNKALVFSDDLSVQTREQHLQGLAACQEDDVQHKNWLSKCQHHIFHMHCSGFCISDW